MSSDIQNLILNRRTVHDYKSEKVPKDIVDEALKLSVWAMNHKLTSPWRWGVLGPEVRSRVANLAVEIKEKKEQQKLSEGQVKSTLSKFTSPSDLLVVGQVRAADAFRQREDFAAVACALQNMSLFLWSKSVGTKWSTGEITRHPKIYEWVGWNPESIEIVGFFWIGFALKEGPIPPRPPFETIVTRTP